MSFPGCSQQLGKTRSRKDILEGWVIEGSDFQPGLLDILKASRTPEVRYPRSPIGQVFAAASQHFSFLLIAECVHRGRMDALRRSLAGGLLLVLP